MSEEKSVLIEIVKTPRPKKVISPSGLPYLGLGVGYALTRPANVWWFLGAYCWRCDTGAMVSGVTITYSAPGLTLQYSSGLTGADGWHNNNAKGPAGEYSITIKASHPNYDCSQAQMCKVKKK